MSDLLSRVRDMYPIKGVVPTGNPPYSLPECLAFLGISDIPSDYDPIRAMARKFQLRYHPDRNNNSLESTEIMKIGLECFTTIKDAYEMGLLPPRASVPAASVPVAPADFSMRPPDFTTPSSDFAAPNSFWATYKPKPLSKRKESEARARAFAKANRERLRRETYIRRKDLGLFKVPKKSILKRGPFRTNNNNVRFGPMPSSWYQDKDYKRFLLRKKLYSSRVRQTFKTRRSQKYDDEY